MEKRIPVKVEIAANQDTRERDYWLEKLSGEPGKSRFPYDTPGGAGQRRIHSKGIVLDEDVKAKLVKISKGTDHMLHVVLAAGLSLLLHKYTGSSDIIIGTPIYKQETGGAFINTVLVLRNRIEGGMTFKEFLLQVKQAIIEAVEHQNYPLELLADRLNMPAEHGFPLFDIALLLENIHDPEHICGANPNLTFFFSGSGEKLAGRVEYNGALYNGGTIEGIGRHLAQLLKNVLTDPGLQVLCADMLAEEEKKRILVDFNDTAAPYPGDKTIPALFEEQAARTPHHIALGYGNRHLTYSRLNERANRLARILRARGVRPDTIVGLLSGNPLEPVLDILAVLKAGGAYLPLDSESPYNRLRTMLEDSAAPILLADAGIFKTHSFTALQDPGPGIESRVIVTPPRPHIKDFDSLPVPDRSLVNYETYNRYIDLNPVKDCLALQTSRGCPYKCAYCHKIWPKTHVVRSAENIFNEVKTFYDMGVRRFSLIDDIFNLDKKNSTEFFHLIIKNKLDVQLYFSAGMRGDILSRDYIDLMVEAGAAYVALALETASPRLQKFIGKHLNLEKMYENMKYICDVYPRVITALFVMLGFPTETEEEAMMTMDFLKKTRWIHFPYINVLIIYPNTDMAKLAAANGISPAAIARSEHMAYHQLPETLPFDKSFATRFQADFLSNYFLSGERLIHVLPYQMKVMTESEMVEKYNSYLPNTISSLDELLKFTGIKRDQLAVKQCPPENYAAVPGLNKKMASIFPPHVPAPDALKVLLLDLSQPYSSGSRRTDLLVEAPLGLLYLLTYLNRQLGNRVSGKIQKAMIDFDNDRELKKLLDEFRPDVIGIRTLTFYRDFFHRTVGMIRHWGIGAPIIAGGPYASSDYNRLLLDRNIDLAVPGEGELTFCDLIRRIIDNDGKLPAEAVLKEIPGLAFMSRQPGTVQPMAREILFPAELDEIAAGEAGTDLCQVNKPTDLAYINFTSGSTGKQKGVMVTHRNVARLIKNTNYIRIAGSDRILQTGVLEFDASTFEIWGAWLNGAALYLADIDLLLAPDTLKQLIENHKITIMWMTSPLFNQMVQLDIDIFKPLNTLLVGGDVLSPAHINRLKRKFPALTVLNGYGPTENTTFSTVFVIDKEYGDRIPIGRPTANSTAYILDKYGHLLPVGVPGELYVGGDGVSRGYMNNPQLTAEAFIDFNRSYRSYGSSPGQKTIYKTGDQACWLPGGSIEFLGRTDRQVKIRGIRIELGEIESHLLAHEKIREAVVTITRAERQICAYVVTNGDISVPGLRDSLAKELPGYMVPVYIVQLDKLPLTPCGKIDRQQLPDPQLAPEEKCTAPADETDAALVGTWAEVLGVPGTSIGVHMNFFQLGGHSLKATILASRIHQTFDIKISLRELFARPTIAEQAEYIRQAGKDKFLSIKPAEKNEYYVLSSAQRRLYFLHRVEPGNLSYNTPMAVILEGELDRGRLESVFRALTRRHESFRTSFEMQQGDPVQRIYPGGRLSIAVYEAREEEAAGIVQRFIHRPFDLSCAPLLRLALIKLNGLKHILVVDMHHIICDGTSMGILAEEFMALYRGEEPPPPVLQYRDYAEWENSDDQQRIIGKMEEYWLQQFLDPAPPLNLPFDFPRPAARTFEGSIVQFKLEKPQYEGLKKVAAGEDATLFMVLLGIFNVLLARLGDRDDITIGTSIANRRHADFRHTIGMFVNALALRNRLPANKTFRQFLREVRENTMNAYENQEYMFDSLVEKTVSQRDPGRNPVFDVMFVLNNEDVGEVEIPALKLKPCDYDIVSAQMDLKFRAVEVDDHLLFVFEYSTGLFKKETVELFVENFKEIAACVLENSDAPLEEIKISHGLQSPHADILDRDDGDFGF